MLRQVAEWRWGAPQACLRNGLQMRGMKEKEGLADVDSQKQVASGEPAPGKASVDEFHGTRTTVADLHPWNQRYKST